MQQSALGFFNTAALNYGKIQAESEMRKIG